MMMEKTQIYTKWLHRLEANKGRRGNPASRARLEKLHQLGRFWPHSGVACAAAPRQVPDAERQALGLARQAAVFFDEHGAQRGDHLITVGLDAVSQDDAKLAPYLDSGGAGLGLVRLDRTRNYANSSKYRRSSASTTYLVGRNENGTFFAHAVARNCRTIVQALDWIWASNTEILQRRQGDVAVISSPGPRYPRALPEGHRINADAGLLVHATHPLMPLPGPGERLIVARRAAARVSEQTRD